MKIYINRIDSGWCGNLVGISCFADNYDKTKIIVAVAIGIILIITLDGQLTLVIHGICQMGYIVVDHSVPKRINIIYQ